MKYGLIALMLLATPVFAAERSVHDLGAVESAIKQPEGKRDFADQIEGKTDTGPLGTMLPPGPTRDAIVRLLAPQADPALITLVGAKSWPHPAGGYVAIVCAAHDAKDKTSAPARPSCESHPDVYLGLLALPPGGEAKLIARTPTGFVLNSDWSPPDGSPLLLPSVSPVNPKSGFEFPSDRSDDEVMAFDLAAYRIGPETFAFGLRSDQHEGYAGGGAVFETLHLFLADGTTLRRVLAQPIYASSMIAGDWHSNGTREHQVNESKLVVAIAPSMTAGHYDLRVKELGTRNTAILHWRAATSAYWVPGGPP